MNKWWPHTFVVCASLITGYLIFVFIILPGGPFHWDEAAHSLWGLLIAYDIQQGDWLSFIYDTYRQVYWPPFYSWLSGIVFLVASPTTITARTVSLITFIMTPLILYLAARQMREQGHELAGIISAILFLTSPPLVMFAAKSMLEMPGLLAMSLTFLIYFKVTRADTSPRQYMLLGLGIALTFFVRLDYGVLLFISVVTTLLIDVRFHLRLLLTRNSLYIALPLLLLFPVWFAYPPKLLITWHTLVNKPVGAEPFSIEGWFYYPLAFFNLSGSMWLFALLLASLLAAFRLRQNKNVRFLLVLVLTQILIGLLHHSRRARHIFPILPALFLLAGYALAEWRGRLRQSIDILQLWLLRLLTGALILHAMYLFTISLHPPPAAYRNEVSSFVATAVRETGTTFILGTRDLNHPNPPLLDWQLIAEERLMAAPHAGSITQAKWEQRIAAALTRDYVPSWLQHVIRPVLARANHPGMSRSFYMGFPNTPNFLNQAELDTFFQNTLNSNSFDGVVVITSLAAGARYPLEFIAPSLQKAGLHHVSTQQFKDMATRVDLYRRQP